MFFHNIVVISAIVVFLSIGLCLSPHISEEIAQADSPPTITTFAGFNKPFSICSDGANIWVTNWGSNNVTKLRSSDGTILGTYNVGTKPLGICLDDSSVWVANWGSKNVTKLRASDGSTIGTYSVGSFPHYICFDGANIWVTNAGSNNVMKLQASDGRIIGTYDTSTPVGICFDGANIWVTNYDGTTVSRLPAIPPAESSSKINQIPAPQILPNISPIIIISCIALLLVLFTFSASKRLMTKSRTGRGKQRSQLMWLIPIAAITLIGVWLFGTPFGKLLLIFVACLLVVFGIFKITKFFLTRRKAQKYIPQSESRFIPDWIKREVAVRDGNQCRHINWLGMRCKEKRNLEYDHVIPWSGGGESTVENLRLLCQKHNRQKGARQQ